MKSDLYVDYYGTVAGDTSTLYCSSSSSSSSKVYNEQSKPRRAVLFCAGVVNISGFRLNSESHFSEVIRNSSLMLLF